MRMSAPPLPSEPSPSYEEAYELNNSNPPYSTQSEPTIYTTQTAGSHTATYPTQGAANPGFKVDGYSGVSQYSSSGDGQVPNMQHQYGAPGAYPTQPGYPSQGGYQPGGYTQTYPPPPPGPQPNMATDTMLEERRRRRQKLVLILVILLIISIVIFIVARLLI